MSFWLCVIYEIQKAFVGHTKTVRGPHAARVRTTLTYIITVVN